MVTHISTRYFILLCRDKNEARNYMEILQKFCRENLDLEFNRKS